MPKSHKRTEPVTKSPYDRRHHPVNSRSDRHLIRKFHVLLKLQDRLSRESASKSHELESVQREIDGLGGLDAYQKMSARGQSEERGGGSQKVFIKWLVEIGERRQNKEKLTLLEVGAVRHDNYATHAWIDCTSIDLHSRHPLIQQQDFLKIDQSSIHAKWGAISLSLVVNFVPNPKDRGRMLSIAHYILQEGGYLFLVLPLPCVTNSRYLDRGHLEGLMSVIGFTMLKQKWKSGGKMGYWLYRKVCANSAEGSDLRQVFGKKTVLREGPNRNNFAILL